MVTSTGNQCKYLSIVPGTISICLKTLNVGQVSAKNFPIKFISPSLPRNFESSMKLVPDILPAFVDFIYEMFLNIFSYFSCYIS